MKVFKIGAVLQDGKLIYPATITDAIVDPRTKRVLSDILKEMGATIVVDENLDSNSDNPVQNKAIAVKINEKTDKVEFYPVVDRVDDIEDFISDLEDLSKEEIDLICIV